MSLQKESQNQFVAMNLIKWDKDETDERQCETIVEKMQMELKKMFHWQTGDKKWHHPVVAWQHGDGFISAEGCQAFLFRDKTFRHSCSASTAEIWTQIH